MEWISVEKELPPINQKFDVWDNHHKKRIADHGAFVGEWDDQFRKETMLIRGHTHWMLQPPPPSSHNSDYAKCYYCNDNKQVERLEKAGNKCCPECKRHFT